MWLFIVDIKNGKLNGAVAPASKLDRNRQIVLKYLTKIGSVGAVCNRATVKRRAYKARLPRIWKLRQPERKTETQGGTPHETTLYLHLHQHRTIRLR